MDLEECVLITDAALSYLAAGCPRLEKLVCMIFKQIKYIHRTMKPTLAQTFELMYCTVILYCYRVCHTAN